MTLNQTFSDYGDILVVDDEASVVEVVALYLKREGFTVRVARDGRSALSAIHEQLPALVVLDLMLPEVDGLEIVRRLRDDAGSDVPVIMLTARRQETDRIYGLELGADDYVTKPFSPAELVSRVKAVLRRTRGTGGEKGGNGRCSTTISPSIPKPASSPCAAAPLTSPPPSLTCSGLWSAIRGRCLSATSSWKTSGASPNTSIPAPSPCTFAACARKLKLIPAIPATC
jgi:CheY-like chemotaxis protein